MYLDDLQEKLTASTKNGKRFVEINMCYVLCTDIMIMECMRFSFRALKNRSKK